MSTKIWFLPNSFNENKLCTNSQSKKSLAAINILRNPANTSGGDRSSSTSEINNQNSCNDQIKEFERKRKMSMISKIEHDQSKYDGKGDPIRQK